MGGCDTLEGNPVLSSYDSGKAVDLRGDGEMMRHEDENSPSSVAHVVREAEIVQEGRCCNF